VRFGEFNPQEQPTKRWPAAFVVARAYLDQLERGEGLSATRVAELRRELDRLEAMPAGARMAPLTELAFGWMPMPGPPRTCPRARPGLGDPGVDDAGLSPA
jgi:hypothetical protein